MDRKRLDKIELELGQLQNAPRGRKPREFIRLAQKLGRLKVNRGKEPNYESPAVPNLGPPLSIPNHPSLKLGTALNILNTLQNDVDLWRQHLDQVGGAHDVNEASDVSEADDTGEFDGD